MNSKTSTVSAAATGGRPVGSYVYQPGKQVHNDICKGPAECIVLVHTHGPNDFMPATK